MNKNIGSRWIKILKESALIIIVFVILMVVIVACLLKVEFSWGFVDRKELLDTTGKILGGYLGCVTAYVTFKCQKELDKEKRQEAIKKEIESKKFMLFSLLDFTIVNTEKLYILLNEDYFGILTSMSQSGIDISRMLKNSSSNNYDIEGGINYDLEDDIIDICKSEYRYQEVHNLISLLNESLERRLYQQDIRRLIYDNKWTEYIDCIEGISNDNSVKYMQRIIGWINLLSSNLANADSIDFVLRRKGIKILIDELAPEIKKKGVRDSGLYS